MPTDEESDYSIDEVSLISECESEYLDNGENIDVDDDEDSTELDVFQIDPSGLIGGEVELVSDDPNNYTVQLFEPVDCHQIPEFDVDAANSLVHGSRLDPQMEVEATRGRFAKLRLLRQAMHTWIAMAMFW